MPMYKVEVVRSLRLRKVLVVEAETEDLAEKRALAFSVEEVCDDSMDTVSSEEDATATRRLTAEEEAASDPDCRA